MALVKCKECGKEVSDKADMCPHCGRRNPSINEEKLNKDIFWNKHSLLKTSIIVFCGIVIFLMFFVGSQLKYVL